MQRLGVALDDRALSGELELDRRQLDPLEEAEVEEREPPVGEQQRVPRVGVAGELPVAVHAAEIEAEEDLADAVTLRLRVALELLEADAVHELAHQHALARELGDDMRHEDERVAFEDARERALVLRLELVVELLDDTRLDLGRDRGWRRAWASCASCSRMIISMFWRSARTAAATPGYCTFTATSRPSSRRVAR